MFFIIGGDGKEYGPATAEQVRNWISAGRANLDTRVKAVGTEEWRPLGDFREFGGSATPPPLPGAANRGTPGGGTSALGADHRELAGIGARTGAALLNAFIYFLSVTPGSMAMTRAIMENNPQLAEGGVPRLEDLNLTVAAESVALVWAGLLAALLVQVVLIAVRGQNLGKLLVGVRVVRIADGAAAGFLHGAVLRFALPVTMIFLLNVLFPLGLLFLFVDYAFMFRADRRCLHDLVAGTKVVQS